MVDMYSGTLCFQSPEDTHGENTTCISATLEHTKDIFSIVYKNGDVLYEATLGSTLDGKFHGRFICKKDNVIIDAGYCNDFLIENDDDDINRIYIRNGIWWEQCAEYLVDGVFSKGN